MESAVSDFRGAPTGGRGPWWLLAAVPLAVFGVLSAAPVLALLASSLDRFDPTTGIVPDLQFGFYRQVLADSYTWDILARTVRVSLLTTLACALAGFPLAAYLVRTAGWRQTGLLIVLLLPLVTSVIVISYGWLILLGQNGLFNAALQGLGITDRPVKLMFSETGMVIALTHVQLVFMTLAVATSLRTIEPNLVLAARSLGAGPWSSFWRIVLPLSLPGLRTGCLLVFSLSMSAYAVPALIGGARLKVLSVLIYQQGMGLLNWPLAATLAVLLLASTSGVLAAVAAFGWWQGHRASRRHRGLAGAAAS
jgi:putative spermidine/putrescine transport system permease protein